MSATQMKRKTWSPDSPRLRRAAAEAKRRYPGPVADLLCMEIRSFGEFGYLFGGDMTRRIIEFLTPDEPDYVVHAAEVE